MSNIESNLAAPRSERDALCLILGKPLLVDGGAVVGHLLQKVVQVGRDHQQCAMFPPQKALRNGGVKELEEAIEVAVNVQHGARFVVDSKLRPGEDFAKLIQRSKAPGKRDKSIGKGGHQRLPFVHRVNNPKVADAGVP